ncbi:MotE family protein [Thermodesulforhabdus norvegica]|uniref:Flagellar motility protein MotE, a chaperone for MotC folding n=1 Tax=Thermodesulforhabdus norvegica TaxID=39841 RepID=A0A1I4R6V7_9BACT|nr:hypothetical protein [Thermodesulforhabdus norvegica]SFM47680.1 Flagellar motility protein MotE, a chaperone for MotC folding [Thermodesulforhabdus norvegica]
MKTRTIFWIVLLSCLGFVLLSGIQLFDLARNFTLKADEHHKPEKNLPALKADMGKNAYAQDKTTNGENTVAVNSDKEESKGANSGETVSTESVAEYMKYLREKELEIQKKEQALKEREKILRELEKDLNTKLAHLEELQKSIEAFNRQQEQLANERLDTLVKIYVTMKPKDAAALLEKLDDDLVTQIISRMSTDQAAKIIASMDIKKAARITQKLTEKKEPLAR